MGWWVSLESSHVRCMIHKMRKAQKVSQSHHQATSNILGSEKQSWVLLGREWVGYRVVMVNTQNERKFLLLFLFYAFWSGLYEVGGGRGQQCSKVPRWHWDHPVLIPPSSGSLLWYSPTHIPLSSPFAKSSALLIFIHQLNSFTP